MVNTRKKNIGRKKIQTHFLTIFKSLIFFWHICQVVLTPPVYLPSNAWERVAHYNLIWGDDAWLNGRRPERVVVSAAAP